MVWRFAWQGTYVDTLFRDLESGKGKGRRGGCRERREESRGYYLGKVFYNTGGGLTAERIVGRYVLGVFLVIILIFSIYFFFFNSFSFLSFFLPFFLLEGFFGPCFLFPF